jgi:hypothetical protein
MHVGYLLTAYIHITPPSHALMQQSRGSGVSYVLCPHCPLLASPLTALRTGGFGWRPSGWRLHPYLVPRPTVPRGTSRDILLVHHRCRQQRLCGERRLHTGHGGDTPVARQRGPVPVQVRGVHSCRPTPSSKHIMCTLQGCTHVGAARRLSGVYGSVCLLVVVLHLDRSGRGKSDGVGMLCLQTSRPPPSLLHRRMGQ